MLWLSYGYVMVILWYRFENDSILTRNRLEIGLKSERGAIRNSEVPAPWISGGLKIREKQGVEGIIKGKEQW